MKAAEQWAKHYGHLGRRDLARRIQADALRHAAKIVDDRRHNGLDTDLRSIRMEIEVEVAKLEAK